MASARNYSWHISFLRSVPGEEAILNTCGKTACALQSLVMTGCFPTDLATLHPLSRARAWNEGSLASVPGA